MTKLLQLLTNLWTARVLVIVGLVFGHRPIGQTFSHIGDEDFLLVDTAFLTTHGYYHFFREAIGDLAGIAVILAIIFAAPKFRNPTLWWIMLITMFGIFAPFWIGAPFMTELRAPNINAEFAHLRMAVPAVIGCFLAKRYYFESQ
ncbi:MAG: hypothetical protein VX929_07145 [Pseudomonadota bacterium]|nr:hypothetical protein [Pseudomonadota bacterium]